MEPVRQIQKKYCSRAMTIAIIAGFAFVLAGYKSVAKGLIMGTLFSVINFILMGETLPSRMIPSRGKAFFVSLSSILVRYALLAIPLFVSLRYKEANFVAAVVGIFMLQLVILAEYVLNFIALRRGKI